MLTNKDMEKLWLRYQQEGVSRNMTLQAYCSMNNVPYNSFEKYLKTRRGMSEVYKVNITDTPEDSESNRTEIVSEQKVAVNHDKESHNLIYVNIRMTNGIQISQGNLSYRSLKQLIEKLEVLC